MEKPEQQQANEEISGTVDQVETQTCQPVTEGGGCAAGDQVGQGTQCPKGQPEKPGDDSPEQGGPLLFPKGQGDPSQKGAKPTAPKIPTTAQKVT